MGFILTISKIMAAIHYLCYNYIVKFSNLLTFLNVQILKFALARHMDKLINR